MEALFLLTVPLMVLLDLLKAVWHLPLRKVCSRTLFRGSCTAELARLSGTLPWDDPISRTLDRRKRAGKSCRFCSESIHSFSHTLFNRQSLDDKTSHDFPRLAHPRQTKHCQPPRMDQPIATFQTKCKQLIFFLFTATYWILDNFIIRQGWPFKDLFRVNISKIQGRDVTRTSHTSRM